MTNIEYKLIKVVKLTPLVDWYLLCACNAHFTTKFVHVYVPNHVCIKYFVLIQGTIGRTLKEALSVACLSRWTYKKAINVLSLYKEWKTKKQTSGKVNAMLFGQLPGNRDKSNVHNLLNLMEFGAMGKKEVNQALKEAKL